IRAALADEATVPMAVAPVASVAAPPIPPVPIGLPAPRADSPRAGVRRVRLPATVAAMIGLVLVAALVAAAWRLPVGPFGVRGAPWASPAADRSPARPTATPAPPAKAGPPGGKGPGHGHEGHGGGNDRGGGPGNANGDGD